MNYAYVVIDTSGDGSAAPVLLRTHTGTQSGTALLTLNPGTTLRSTPGSFALMFQFVSDASYSDEDGLDPTACGHSTIDNISLSGAVVDQTTFETGTNGWILEFPRGLVQNMLFDVGDWSDLKAVADLPGNPCACSFQDSLLVFFDPSIGAGGGHGLDQDNLAMSPWIDLEARELTPEGPVIIEYEGHFSLRFSDQVFVRYAIQWMPLACDGGGGPISGIEGFSAPVLLARPGRRPSESP